MYAHALHTHTLSLSLSLSLCLHFRTSACVGVCGYVLPARRLPEDRTRGGPVTWRRVGMYTEHGRLPSVLPNVRLHRGWFSETLPPFLDAQQRARGGGEGAPPPQAYVAFAHLDADLYSSTSFVLNEMGRRCLLANGTVLSFDELFGHPTLVDHEHRALTEASRRWGFTYEYITWMLHPESKYGRAAVAVTNATRTPSACEQEER